MKKHLWALSLLAGLLSSPVEAQITQNSLGLAAHFQGFSFDKALGVTAANLFMLPVAYELPLGRTVSLDFYSAYARGAVEVADTVYHLNGFVDTRIRANWAATPWAMLTVGLNIPTGDSKHDSEEAVVSNVLATEVLGFREASWGLGFGATTGVVTAHRFGGLGVGVGVSYRLGSEIEPSADTTLKYTPGDETRVRLALDGTVGGNTLTAGLTYQNYTRDKLDGRDLFQPGKRWRGDLTYSFRTGSAATWTLYAADIWREHGNVQVQDSAFSTGQQNVLVTGLSGAIRFSPTFSLRPSADVRVLTRQETGGEGWIAGVGGDVPLRWGSVDVFPYAKVLFGQLEGATTERSSTVGAEVSLSLRWGHGN